MYLYTSYKYLMCRKYLCSVTYKQCNQVQSMHPDTVQDWKRDLLSALINDACIPSSSLCVQLRNCATDLSATMEDLAIMEPVSVQILSMAQAAVNTPVSNCFLRTVAE